MDIKQVFVDRTNALRSGWRFGVFIGAWLLASMFFAGVAWMIVGAGHATAERFLVYGIASLIPAVLVGWLCGKFLEGLPFRALGAWFTRFWLRHLALGLLAGVVTMSAAVLIASAFGGLRFALDTGHSREEIVSSLVISLLIFAVGAAFEEAIFRGYILQTFNRSGLGWFAILLTSAFFGFVHIRNPDAGAISTINTVLAGVWFGVAYLKTRDLWFVWGMHLMWNWQQGSIFGIEVSGLTDITTAPLLKEIDRGPMWLTGESYGIEGGIACTVAIVISIAAIQFLPVFRPGAEMVALTSPPKET